MVVYAPAADAERTPLGSRSVSLLGGALVLGEDRVPAGRSRWRAAARFDEDAVTLAAEAAAQVLPDTLDRVGSIILATVTPPYSGGGSVQALAEILGMQGPVFALDLCGSARDGVAALRLAAALVRETGPVLVCAAHAGWGESPAGDGAVALLLGDNDAAAATEAAGEPLAKITPAASSAIELRDRWQLRGEAVSREADRSFVQSIGTERMARELLAGVPASLAGQVILVGPDAQASAGVERSLDGVKDAVTGHTGRLGAAHPLVRLLAALDGPPSLVVAVANGLAEAVHVAPGAAAADVARATRELCEHGGTQLERAPAAASTPDFDPYASAPRAWRDRDVDLRLRGLVGPADGLAIVPGRKHPLGTVVARTQDFVYPAAPSTELAVVAMDDGGQFYGQVAVGEHAAIGDRVELVPRRLHHGGGTIQYFWKVKPCP
jgi:hypothetical protein